MKTRTYYVSEIGQALEKITKDLGPEASVVHTRRLPKTIWNMVRGRRLEVVASADLDVPQKFAQWLEEGETELAQLVDPRILKHDKDESPTLRQKVEGAESADFDQGPSANLGLKEGRPAAEQKEQGKVEESVEWDPVQYWLRQLCGDEVSASQLTTQLLQEHCRKTGQSPSTADCPPWDQLAQYLGRLIQVGGSVSEVVSKAKTDGRAAWVAIVGPTGVGKTTTIAKLAGQFQKYQGLRVGLVTVDTFRVGAIDQLQTYSKIMGLPFRVVSSLSEVEAAKQQMVGCDLVLVDTVGRSPRDQGRIDRLKDILETMGLDHLLLTLCSNSSVSSLNQSLKAFSSFQTVAPNSLVISKIDEMESLTGLWPFLSQCPLPWSYWTNGQNVPEDIGETRPNVALWFLDKIPLAEKSAAV